MSTKSEIIWPRKATHARQLVDGVAVVVRRDNFDTLIPGKSFDFGIWKDRQFMLVPEDADPAPARPVAASAPVVVTAAGVEPSVPVARPAGRPVLAWGGRRRLMGELILDGQLTAREIASEVLLRFPGETTFEKALAQVRGVPQHLKLAGIRATYRKEGGAPVVNY